MGRVTMCSRGEGRVQLQLPCSEAAPPQGPRGLPLEPDEPPSHPEATLTPRLPQVEEDSAPPELTAGG